MNFLWEHWCELNGRWLWIIRRTTRCNRMSNLLMKRRVFPGINSLTSLPLWQVVRRNQHVQKTKFTIIALLTCRFSLCSCVLVFYPQFQLWGQCGCESCHRRKSSSGGNYCSAEFGLLSQLPQSVSWPSKHHGTSCGYVQSVQHILMQNTPSVVCCGLRPSKINRTRICLVIVK